MTRLAIVIVSYNAREDLDRCLGSLSAAPPRVPHHVIVVDNASSDGSVDRLHHRWPETQVIALDANLGFSRANNRGIRQADGELVLLLNSDTIVPAGAIDGLVAALLDTPSAAAAGPRLVDGDGVAEVSFGRMVSPLAEVRQKSFVRGVERRDGLALARLERELSRRSFRDWVSGACLLVRRTEAEAVGLLDERYFMYLEDVDFCAALRARGRQILFAPDVSVTHLRGRSRQTASVATQAAYRRSHLAFYEKHHPVWAPLLRWYLKLKGDLPPRIESS